MRTRTATPGWLAWTIAAALMAAACANRGGAGPEGPPGPKGDPGEQGQPGVTMDAGSPSPGASIAPSPGPLTSKHAEAHAKGTPHADRIIFFLGDGMGITTITAARIFAKGEDGYLTMDTLPNRAFVRTYSRDSRVTDSAPSMAAYMTGEKMNNDVISMKGETPFRGEGEAVVTLLEWAKAAGWGTGVVTTTRVTHATPAATYAHISDRDMENEIARQLVPGGAGFNTTLGDSLDVVFGGGRRHFLPKSEGGAREDGRNLITELSAKGFTYVKSTPELEALTTSKPNTKVLGLFNNSHIAYELSRDPAVEPSVADMAVKAVQLLNQNPNGYFLMVEGGRIDHALHETTAKKALVETIAFDNAIARVLEEVKKSDPNLERTLIVATADHDHTLVHLGYAQRTGPTTQTNPGVLGLARSYTTGEVLKDADGQPYTILAFGNGEKRISGLRTQAPLLTDAEVSGNDYHQEAAVRMPVGAETHGGTDVALFATGFGSDTLTGFLTNTEIFKLLKDATKL